jgi:DNA primase
MFPIIDVSGNVIAFGGRVMDDSKPKYKNSSDTPVFKKSRNLFALNFAKNFAEESLILCEGYMDVIALHAAGFSNAIATLGTAITSEQARVLSRYTKRIIISYDADEAGQKAAKRAMQLLGEVGLEVSVLKIPDAKDPDEYIKKHGRDNFAHLLKNTKSKFEYNVEGVLGKYNLELPQDKINAIADIEKLISEVYSSAERDVYIHAIAKRLSVDPRSIKDDVERMVARKMREGRRAEEKRIKETTAGFSDRINPDYVKAPAIAKNEENVLGFLLLYPDKRKIVFADKLLCADDFYTEFNKRVFSFIESAHLSGDDSSDWLNENFTPEEVGRIMKMKINRMAFSSADDTVLYDSIDSLKRSVQKKEAVKTSTFEGLDAILKRKRDS